jgi:Mannosyltransferase (PIG-M)
VANGTNFRVYNVITEREAKMIRHDPSDRAWLVILVFYLCLIYPPLVLSYRAANLNFLKGDCYYYRAAVVSLLEDGDLLLANNISDISDHLNMQLALGKEGLVPKHPVLMPLFSIPFYLLLKDKGLLLFNVVDCMILMVLIFKLNRLFFDGYIAFTVTALYATGTLFFDYVYNYSPDVFSTVLVLGGLYLVLQRKFYAGALLLGLSVFAKISNALLAGIGLSYVGFKILFSGKGEQTASQATENSLLKKVGVMTTAVAVFLLSLVPLAYTNYKLFGSPFVTGYQRMALAGRAPGEILAVSDTGSFNQSLLKGAYLLLFDRYHGVIPTNPVVFLAFLGLFQLRRNGKQEKFYFLLAICLAQFLLFSKYDEQFASHFSNRYLMTFVALSSVFTGSFLKYVTDRFLCLNLMLDAEAIRQR